MTNNTETNQNETSWADGLFEPLSLADLANEPNPAYLDPDFDDAFSDLEAPLQVDGYDDWIVSDDKDLARSVAANPSTIRTLLHELARLGQPHHPDLLRDQVASAVSEHGLAPIWLTWLDAHIAAA
jgi:hypothetical protein